MKHDFLFLCSKIPPSLLVAVKQVRNVYSSTSSSVGALSGRCILTLWFCPAPDGQLVRGRFTCEQTEPFTRLSLRTETQLLLLVWLF